MSTPQGNPDSRRESPLLNGLTANTGSAVPHTGHSLQANERREMMVRGVQEVLSFDEHNVRLVTTAGVMNLEGRELRIHTLNTGDGVVAVTGVLDGVLYENESAEIPSNVSTQGKRRFGRGR